MGFLNDPGTQITAVLGAIILIVLGRNKILPAISGSKFLLWLAFLVTILCGLMLGVGLGSVASWVIGWDGPISGVIGSVGQILALAFGWWALYLLVGLARDLIDIKPDGDARMAALWVPTALPAGGEAVFALLEDPRGIGTGIKALIMAAITVGACIAIINSSLKGSKMLMPRKYFAALIALIAGLTLIPIAAYLFGWIGPWINKAGTWFESWHLLVLIGIAGFALLVAGIRDIVRDKAPDREVRLFLMLGVPFLTLAAGVALGFMSSTAGQGLNNMAIAMVVTA